jgi:IS5 family transposase
MHSTVVGTNIHLPTDSTLLQDGIRIITRWLAEGQELSPQPEYAFADHNRRAKKRCLEIQHAKKEAVREKAYKDLLGLARRRLQDLPLSRYITVRFPSGVNFQLTKRGH